MPSGIYIRTEYHNKINSESHRGQKVSEEQKINISKRMIKLYEDPKEREKQSKYHLGKKYKPMSKEGKINISKAHKGINLSEYHKEKLRVSWTEGRRRKLSKRMTILLKGNKITLGRKLSKEHREKISEALKYKKKPPRSEEHRKNISKSWNKSKERIKNMLRRRIPTILEEKFQKIIDKYDLPYKYVGDGSFIIGGYNPDFINTNSEKIAIEVYARYYKLRNNKSIKQWKEGRSKIFRKYGWEIIYFNELEVNDSYILEVLNKL